MFQLDTGEVIFDGTASGMSPIKAVDANRRAFRYLRLNLPRSPRGGRKIRLGSPAPNRPALVA